MTIATDKLSLIENLAPHLLRTTEGDIDLAIETGEILKDVNFYPDVDHPFGQFYAPFDWINDKADIVLIGITPGRRQAKTAMKTLKRAIASGKEVAEAAALAKQAASFEGDMREFAAQLMDRFELQKLFGLRSCRELFESASHRTHYTSLLRYPVLHWQTKKRKNGTKETRWFDYGGGDHVFKRKLLVQSREADFEREIVQFRDAWLVPFGPTPAKALARLADRGALNPDRILHGINHPSPSQRNRHACQLNRSDDHSDCAWNVGCSSLRERSRALEGKVAEFLSQSSKERAP
jgi:hypothetical protein